MEIATLSSRSDEATISECSNCPTILVITNKKKSRDTKNQILTNKNNQTQAEKTIPKERAKQSIYARIFFLIFFGTIILFSFGSIPLLASLSTSITARKLSGSVIAKSDSTLRFSDIPDVFK